MELVLFEVDEEQNNLPAAEEVQELCALAEGYDFSYTVHLPLDLRLGAAGAEQELSIQKALCTIAATRLLEPKAFILHLDGRELRGGATEEALGRWKEQAKMALEILAGESGGKHRLAVENLENYPPGFWERALPGLPAGRCLDIGHLWLEGTNPLPVLEQAWAQISVIHLHGVKERDHASLEYSPPEQLDALLKLLVQGGYPGVLTMEVFGLADFEGSLRAVQESCRRIGVI